LIIGQNILLGFEKTEQASGYYFLYSVQDTSAENHRTLDCICRFILSFDHVQREQPSASGKNLKSSHNPFVVSRFTCGVDGTYFFFCFLAATP
jgi:hypothetical protein